MEEENYDLISNLPFDILKRIISFLPLEQAMKTSQLSTVWRSLWVPVELNFNHEKQILDLVSKSYDIHQVWKLCSNSKFQGETETNIALAVKGVNEELFLQFLDRETEQVIKNLCLKLEPCSCFSPVLFSFSSLKILHVKSLSNLSKDIISALFSTSQFLETFKLENCNGLEILEIEATHFLRSLKVINCPDMVRVSVSATNLRTFWYQGKLPDQFQLKNTSNLVEMVLDLRNCKEFDCEDVLSLLASIKHIEILRISGWLFEWLCSAGVIFRMLDFEFEKLKELKWMDSVMNKNKKDSMACFLNICPVLEKLVIEIDPKRGSLVCPYFHHYWHEPHLWMDNSAMKCNSSKLENLKVVDLVGNCNEEDELMLIDLLLNKANLVKSVSVTSPDHHSWQVAKIPDDQLNQTWQPRDINQQNQKNVVLSLINGFLSRIFGEI
ncbi:hypothetical protein COLO4_14873 [Corchorus olitorius]|uniref:F-box domain-containing protein n=1 Tax=Corchorus olitorius TaxID=93759 RepID=A0A1R3JQV6_9ROSI|nr:hypothetical protein COLO4_14873 [Corchorus olitorius]